MIVYRKSIELVCILHKQVMPKLQGRDRELHQQMHRAVRSVVLNAAEARAWWGAPRRSRGGRLLIPPQGGAVPVSRRRVGAEGEDLGCGDDDKQRLARNRQQI